MTKLVSKDRIDTQANGGGGKRKRLTKQTFRSYWTRRWNIYKRGAVLKRYHAGRIELSRV